ncbi:hypothetical protein [Evansella clarkii]|nr:hypothetical protein [Evansella clarkii]
MRVEDLEKIMTEIKERSEQDPNVDASTILQLIKERLESGLKTTKNNR